MKRVWKKRLGICLYFFGMALLLTACKGSAPGEGQIKEDMPEEARMIYVDSGFGEEEILLDVTEVNILKRQTNEKDDTVYCTISMENDNYQYVANWVLMYTYYDQGGWILDEWYLDQENVSAEITPLSGISQDVADAEMGCFNFDSCEFLNQLFESEKDHDIYRTTFEYAVEHESTNCSYSGTAGLSYYFYYVGGNYGYWKNGGSGITYDDDWVWDIEGVWECSNLEDNNGYVHDFSIEIQSFNQDNTTIELSATQVDRGFGGQWTNTPTQHSIDVKDHTYYDRSEGMGCDEVGNPIMTYELPRILFWLPFGESDYEFAVTIEADGAYVEAEDTDDSDAKQAELVRKNEGEA